MINTESLLIIIVFSVNLCTGHNNIMLFTDTFMQPSVRLVQKTITKKNIDLSITHTRYEDC